MLDNDYFNPNGKSLDDAGRNELDQLLKSVIEQERGLEHQYFRLRKTFVDARLAGGQFEKNLGGEAGARQGRPLSNEEEVISVDSSRYGNTFVRINWGDSQDIDQKRLELLEFKTACVEQVCAFVKQNGK